MRKIIVTWLCVILVFSSAIVVMDVSKDAEGKAIVRDEVTYTISDPFRINNNSDFASSPKVTPGGNGSAGNPWIIENYDVDGTGYGYCIYIGNTTEYFVVRDCYLYEASSIFFGQYYSGNGIALYNVQNGIIQNNEIAMNGGFGMYLWSTSNTIIFNNTVSWNNDDNIELCNSDGNTISDNHISYNSHRGLVFSSSSNNIVLNNTISDHDLDGISIWSSINNIFTNNTMINDGIVIAGTLALYWNSHDIDTSNTVNDKPVRYLKDQNSGTVPSGAGQAILANCLNIVVEDQNMGSGAIDVHLGFSNNCSISNNTLTNSNYGIQLYQCKNNTFFNNIISDNFFGIRLEKSINNTIVKNSMSSNTYGISIYLSSTGNKVINNTMSSNLFGIEFIAASDNNMVYHNSFINNFQAASDNSINSWDNGYPVGGNYWNNYSGIDNNNGPNQDIPGADGIGDTPYTFISGTGGAQDDYPLMESYNAIPHLPIRIDSNADFDEAHGIVNWDTGDGTAGNPWIIENYDIDGTGYGYCIYIGNTTEYFIVRNCDLYEASGGTSWPFYYNQGLSLYNVANGTVSKTNASSNNNGIYLYSCHDTILSNNSVSDNYEGINLRSSNDIMCVNNTASNNTKGICTYQSSYISITNNTASSIESDIDLSSSYYITASNNIMQVGIVLAGPTKICWNTHSIDNSNTVSGDVVQYWKNQAGGKIPAGAGQVILANCTNVVVENLNVSLKSAGIEIGFSSNILISNNTAYSDIRHGISLYYSNNNIITNNTASDNRGVFLYTCSSNTITYNNVSYTEYGILVTGGTGNTVSYNNATYCDTGIGLSVSNNNNMAHNLVQNNTMYGVWLYINCAGNKIENNSILTNDLGIIFMQSNTNTLSNNTIHSNTKHGIYFMDSFSNTITNNTVSSNMQYGIYLLSSSNNIIYLNIFKENSDSVYDEGTNIWNASYPIGGNYWDDYAGVDDMSGPDQDVPGSDGIGDTNYDIWGGANKDYYPLIEVLYEPHLPIRIDSNADFDEAHGVVNWDTGDGSAGNPWIIEGWDIDGTGYGYCIYIGNTTEHFEVRGCYLHDADGVDSKPYYYDSGLILYNSTNGLVSGTNSSFNYRSGIYAQVSDNITISQNNLTDNNYGVYLDNSDNNTVTLNNADLGNYYGVYVYYSDNNTVSHNEFHYNDFSGVYHQASTNSSIYNNSITYSTLYGGIYLFQNSRSNDIFNNSFASNNGHSISFDASPYNRLWSNKMTNEGIWITGPDITHWNTHNIDITNLVNNKPVRYWKNVSGGTVLTDSGQVILANCTGVTVEDQIIIGGYTGIMLGFSNKNTIINNDISNNYYGIRLDRSDSNNISSNTANSNLVDGIYMGTSEFNNVTDNIANDNWAGIQLLGADNNNITFNTASSNDNHGIFLWVSGPGNLLANNTIEDNDFGIYFSSSDGNTVINNSIDSNFEYGIRLTTSNNNDVYHNSFTNKGLTYHAYDDGSNFWDNGYPSGGNHWDDYTGVDLYGTALQDTAPSDGIGDTAYTNINGGSEIDNYPLMKPMGFVDTFPPTSSIDPLLAYTNIPSIIINATASDSDSAVAYVELWYRYRPTSLVAWSPWTFFETDATSPWSWTFAFPDGEGVYEFYSVANDTSGNEENEVHSSGDANCVFDMTPPVITDYTPTSGTTSENFTFQALVMDALTGSIVYILHWYGSGPQDNTTPNDSQGFYNNHTIQLNGISLDTLHYQYVAVDDCGNWAATPVKDVTVIDNDPPVANSEIPQYSDPGQVVQFNGSRSHDNIGIVNYTWNFMDNGVNVELFGELASYTFMTPGDYTITLTVKDAAGYSATETRVHTVLALIDNEHPVADAGPDQTVDEGTIVTFDGSGSTDNIGVDNYTWTFNDGVQDVILYGVAPSHNFTVEGNYTVTLTVRDAADNIDTDTMVVTVESAPLDTDDDGIPDDTDPDDDNDGFLDEWEEVLGTNPKDSDDNPTDTDGDGIPDGDADNSESWMDTDDDDDGVADVDDPDPLDPRVTGRGGIGDYWWIILIIIAAAILGLVVVMRKGKKPPSEELEPEDEDIETAPVERVEPEEPPPRSG